MPDASVAAALPLPDVSTFVCCAVVRHSFGYLVTLAGRARGGACPKCGVVSVRVHARYERRVRDLPIQGERVLVRLRCRKFLCRNHRCAQRIFCERFGPALPSFARSTARLERALAALALATSANLAARLGRLLGLPGSARSILPKSVRGASPSTTSRSVAAARTAPSSWISTRADRSSCCETAGATPWSRTWRRIQRSIW
jgi:transposase